jgi:hypothetical protein
VPPVFTSASIDRSVTEQRTSIWAARWKTTCGGRAERADHRLDVADGDLEKPRAASAPARELHCGAHVVDDRDVVPTRDERVRKVRADEPGAAGHERAHRA